MKSKFFSTDARLTAIGPGPQPISWRTWRGEIEPVVNSVIAGATPIIKSGLTIGQTLTAEPAPISQAMLGVVFDGAYERYRQAIVGARADGSATGSDTVDVSAVTRHTLNLQEMLENSDHRGAEGALHALQAATDAIRRSRQRSRTGDTVNASLGAREALRVREATEQFRQAWRSCRGGGSRPMRSLVTPLPLRALCATCCTPPTPRPICATRSMPSTAAPRRSGAGGPPTRPLHSWSRSHRLTHRSTRSTTQTQPSGPRAGDGECNEGGARGRL